MKTTPRWHSCQLFGTVCILFLLATVATAQWSHDPSTNNPLTDDQGYFGKMTGVSDGENGAIGFWTRDNQIFGQRIDADGQRRWGNNAIQLLDSDEWDGKPRFVTDHLGGFFMTWEKPGAAGTLIYAQHFDGDGNPTWGSSGVQVQQWVISGTIQSEPQIVGDGEGGIVVTYINDPSNDAEIYAQRLSAGGSRLWSNSVVTDISATKTGLTMAAGHNPGEVAVAWQQSTASNGWDLLIQKLSGDGEPLWSEEDMDLAIRGGNQTKPKIACTGTGDVIAIWSDDYNGYPQVYYQRKWFTGNNGWSSDYGARWRGFYDHQEKPLIASNAQGDVFMLCIDQTESGGSRIAAQYFPSDQYNYWSPYGRTLHEDDRRSMGEMAMVADNTGGFYAVWEEYVSSNFFSAHQISALGDFTWPEERPAFTVTEFDYFNEPMALVGRTDGGFIAVWEGRSTTSSPHYIPTTQLIDINGYMGDNSFPVSAADDRPNDQGGEVVLSWLASPLDQSQPAGIASYSLWIRQAERSNAMVAGTLPAESSLNDADLSTLLQMATADVTSMRSIGWTFAGQIPAMFAAEYSALCPTFGDSTAHGIDYTDFKVVAHHQDNGVFWVSNNILTAYSADNLAPGAPLQLAAESNEGAVDLTWLASGHQDDDLALYRIYRGTESGFVLDEDSLLGTSESVAYQDISSTGTVYYRVTAVDAHSNEGSASDEVMVTAATAVGDLPTVFVHRGNYPNPFNPMTSIAFDLPRPGHVRVQIFDASGRLVRTLADEVMPAGAQAIQWNGQNDGGQGVASGVYFSRVTSGDESANRRMTLVR